MLCWNKLSNIFFVSICDVLKYLGYIKNANKYNYVISTVELRAPNFQPWPILSLFLSPTLSLNLSPPLSVCHHPGFSWFQLSLLGGSLWNVHLQLRSWTLDLDIQLSSWHFPLDLPWAPWSQQSQAELTLLSLKCVPLYLNFQSLGLPQLWKSMMEIWNLFFLYFFVLPLSTNPGQLLILPLKHFWTSVSSSSLFPLSQFMPFTSLAYL